MTEMRAWREQRGVAAVEFGLVIGLLVLVFFGATELGRAFYQYNSLLKSARAAAREFSLAGPVGTVGSREQLAKCIAVYGVRPCDTGNVTQVMEGLTMDMVEMSSATDMLSGTGVPPNTPYTYGCARISGFHFVSLVPWFDLVFAPITACMRQNPS